jgi:hypothetical protein
MVNPQGQPDINLSGPARLETGMKNARLAAMKELDRFPTQFVRPLVRPVLARLPVVAACILLTAPAAWAQQAGSAQSIGVTPLAPANVTPAGQQFAAPPPDLTPQIALTGAAYQPIKTDATLCVRPVMVDDEPRRWDELQKLGAAQAGLNAYMQGDYARAVPIFLRLAKIGHPEAERLMGVAYYFGQGVPQDYARSLYWFEKAADQGCFAAYPAAAGLYRDGKGTATDLGKAYMWLNIAVSRLPDSVERDALIQEREKVAALMTQAQIEAAQKRSLDFKPKPVVPPDPEDLPVDYFAQKGN